MGECRLQLVFACESLGDCCGVVWESWVRMEGEEEGRGRGKRGKEGRKAV